VQDAIITVDLNLNVTEANHAAASICGLNIKAIKKKPFSQCLKNCSRACEDVLLHTLEKKTAVKDYRVQCRTGIGSDQKASVSSSPLIDNQGRFMGAVLVIRDITLLNKLKRQLCEQHQYHHIIGRSKKMQDLFCLLEKLSDMDTTVLVTGESGTGKELIAKALHHGSHRAFKPFISVNCSALAENLLESELFGHVRGAFTGAFKDSQGRFQAAGSGTVLLDEVGDISPLIQLKLLRVLQDKQYERVGESVTRNMNARIVACTNADLKQKVSRGEFREDLYYRLKVMEIALPPLRERMEDVPLLASHFRSLFNQRFGKEIEGFSKDALAKLMNYSWPGNIRELEHAIERAFVLCSKKMITPEHLPAEILDCCRTPAANGTVLSTDESEPAEEILDALNNSFWNKSRAADLLGISRPTLYKKMRKHRIIK
jgi:PAS domain S-box-containing protein